MLFRVLVNSGTGIYIYILRYRYIYILRYQYIYIYSGTGIHIYSGTDIYILRYRYIYIHRYRYTYILRYRYIYTPITVYIRVYIYSGTGILLLRYWYIFLRYPSIIALLISKLNLLIFFFIYPAYSLISPAKHLFVPTALMTVLSNYTVYIQFI